MDWRESTVCLERLDCQERMEPMVINYINVNFEIKVFLVHRDKMDCLDYAESREKLVCPE